MTKEILKVAEINPDGGFIATPKIAKQLRKGLRAMKREMGIKVSWKPTSPQSKEKQWNCRFGINGWHEKGCPHLKELQQGWEKDIQEEFELGSPDRIKAIIHQLLIKEYRNGYNACLKDFKIKNEFGEKSL